MHVSIRALSGLKHSATITVPAGDVQKEVDLRLQRLARTAKIQGFRPGKVPLSEVQRRFSGTVFKEVAGEMVQSTLFEALQENKLVPAGMPSVEFTQLEPNKDFIYTALFERFPEIKIVELSQDEIEVIFSEINDQDVEEMLTRLREQNKEWFEVTRPIQDGDKVTIDFEGLLGKEPFDGGTAKSYELVIGSGSMIPGFESGLIDGEKDKPFDIKVTFPKDYGHQDLAGKKATFKITVHQIMEGRLPALDAAFAEKFNIKEGIEALKNDIRSNMERELERRVSALNREKIFDKLIECNPFELPSALIEEEIKQLKHEMYHRLYGHEHKHDEKIPDFPRELFEEQAKRRVHLGLLFSEYVKKHELVADKERVNAMIDKLANAYEDPGELRSWYQSSKENMAEIEALVTEEMVSEKMREHAKVIEKRMSYDEVMNPKKQKDTQSKEE